MANDYLSKLNQLSPALQAELSKESFLEKLDGLENQYGIKAVSILFGLLLGEIDYAKLADKLAVDYGFNDFLAEEVKEKFGDLIKSLGNEALAEKASPAFAEPAAPLTFSRADEEEIKKYIASAAAPKVDYESWSKDILDAYGYVGADEVMRKRLQNIIMAKIRDIRDDLETKETLLKSKKVGGLEFTEVEADKLLNLIVNGDSLKISRPAKPVSMASQPTIEMEDGLPVVRMPEILTNSAPVAENSNKINFSGANKLPKPSNDVKIKAEVAVEKKKTELPLPLPRAFISEKKIPESVLNAKTAQRPNLDDVKLEKKLSGPIEELETMTIIDFRRLAADPQAAVNKIKEKVDLLEKTGFNQKIMGIDVWQKSEVCRFYRLLGQLSMSENKTIEAVIKERLIAGKPTLSLDEFHAVMELNRQIRY